MHACRSSFLKAVVEWDHGMSKRDITSNINFFMNVPATAEGKLTFEEGVSEPAGEAPALPAGTYSNFNKTISGLDPRRRGGPQVPAPLEVKTCILPMRLRP